MTTFFQKKKISRQTPRIKTSIFQFTIWQLTRAENSLIICLQQFLTTFYHKYCTHRVTEHLCLSCTHYFVAYTAQLSIAIQHTRNSFLNPHIPRKRLRASSCSLTFASFLVSYHAVHRFSSCRLREVK